MFVACVYFTCEGKALNKMVKNMKVSETILDNYLLNNENCCCQKNWEL